MLFIAVTNLNLLNVASQKAMVSEFEKWPSQFLALHQRKPVSSTRKRSKIKRREMVTGLRRYDAALFGQIHSHAWLPQ
jgi:hypothetical protein